MSTLLAGWPNVNLDHGPWRAVGAWPNFSIVAFPAALGVTGRLVVLERYVPEAIETYRPVPLERWAPESVVLVP